MAEAPTPPQTSSTSESVEASVVTGSVSGQPTTKDFLGFEPYVEAIAGFLTNENTKPPLTLSVEGDWGSGKSSFMQQLEDRLQKHHSAVTARFNAWRHDKEEALWAAFALEFIRKLSEELTPLKRWRAHIKLLIRRFSWQDGWVDVVRAGSIGLIFVAAVIASLLLLFIKGPEWTQSFADMVTGSGNLQNSLLQGTIAAGGIAGYAAIVVSILIKVKNFVGNSLAIDLQQYVTAPDYDSRVAFIEQFHEDFQKIVEVYAGQTKVYIFIDDLDRCEVPKAAELMQALNLMLSESTQLIYIIGMDREKVAAGLAAKHVDVLPYLAPTIASLGPLSDSNGYSAAAGLEYGYSFLEKFVQLPFHVPQPTEEDVKRLVENIDALGIVQPAELSSNGRPSQETVVVDPQDGLDPPTSEDSEKQRVIRKRYRVKERATEDSDLIRTIVLMVSPALDNNPRRILQFINLFRLRTFIACDTALFDDVEGSSDTAVVDDVEGSSPNAPLTLEQLGKFVAITLRWPLLLEDLDREPTLLGKLQEIALNAGELSALLRAPLERGKAETSYNFDILFMRLLRRWAEQPDLIRLLRAGCLDEHGNVDPEKERIYTLSRLDVEKLLQVSPRTKPTPKEAGPSRPDANSDAWVVHIVQPGDTFNILAEKYYGDENMWEIIANANPEAQATQLYPGQELRIPNASMRMAGSSDDASTGSDVGMQRETVEPASMAQTESERAQALMSEISKKEKEYQMTHDDLAALSSGGEFEKYEVKQNRERAARLGRELTQLREEYEKLTKS